MKENIAVVLAGGKGRRMETDIPKQYLKLEGKEIFIRSLEIFDKSETVDRLVLVISSDEEERVQEIMKNYTFAKSIEVAHAGKERYFSVYSALEYIQKNFEAGKVLIHDAARPLMKSELIDKAVRENQDAVALVFAVKSKDTLRRVRDGIFIETLEREEIYHIQTPQIVDFDTLKKAYDLLIADKSLQIGITDDAEVLKRCMGINSTLVEGIYENIKITTIEDIELAKSFLGRGGF